MTKGELVIAECDQVIYVYTSCGYREVRSARV